VFKRLPNKAIKRTKNGWLPFVPHYFSQPFLASYLGVRLTKDFNEMENISIKGIVIAMVVASLLDVVGGVAAIPIFAESMSDVALLADVNDSQVFLYILVVSFITSIIGGHISAQYGKLAPYKNSAIFGSLGVALSIVLATYDPAWVDITGFITTIPAALIGGHISATRNAYKVSTKVV
jgi:hypothetical protein